MFVPIFVDLQDFLIGGHFVVKEFAALKEGHVLFHYIFLGPYLWDLFSKSERHQAMWLIENRHGIQWKDGMLLLDGRKFDYTGPTLIPMSKYL